MYYERPSPTEPRAVLRVHRNVARYQAIKAELTSITNVFAHIPSAAQFVCIVSMHYAKKYPGGMQI